MRKIFSLLFLLVTLLTSCGPQRFIPNQFPDPLPSFYLPDRIRVALVLGSGGVRGMAHIGVIEELEAAGICVDLIVGCSAGSIVGALYADHGCLADAMKAIWQLKTSSILDINLFNCRYGLSEGKPLRRILDKHLCAETFEELAIPLVIVASDLHTGELVPIGAGDLTQAIQASCSIPLVFVPCEYRGRVLVDGGVINPVPVKVARDLGAEIIIAVDLCEMLDKTYPKNLFQVATRSAEIAFMWQNQICTQEADVIIRPKTCGVGAFNDTMKMQIYQAGRAAAREQIPEILELLAKAKPDCKPWNWQLIEPQCYTPQIYYDDSEENEE